MPDNKAFLARVYELSGAKTPTELSRWVGLSLTAVLNWESGKSSPQFKTLRGLQEKTGEDLSSLVQMSASQRSNAGELKPLKVEETTVYETDETSRVLWPYLEMLRAIYDARGDPKHGHRWPILAESTEFTP